MSEHYLTVWMASDWLSGEAQIFEPDKFIDQRWVNFDSLPKPLFLLWEQLQKSEFIDKIKQELAKTAAKEID